MFRIQMYRIAIILTLVLISCGPEIKGSVKKDQEWTQAQSRNLGKELAIEQELEIKVFLEGKPDWDMVMTGSGLRYYVYNRGKDTTNKPKVGDAVCVDLKIDQLDGTNCYQTAKDECAQFLVDKSEAETGLQEAIKLLSVGDEAKLIIPSHIAHGLVGDQDRIPPLTTLLIDVKLIEIGR